MSEWTTEEPEARKTYWLSIHPDKRPAFHGTGFPAVIKCHVDLMSDGFQWVVDGIAPTKHVRYGDRGDWLPLDQEWFSGAQWKLVDPDPADPFAAPPQVTLSPEAERIWKSLSPASDVVTGEDARQLLESLVDVASPEEVARRRAVSRERLAQNAKRVEAMRQTLSTAESKSNV
jgi:hypothetical protein